MEACSWRRFSCTKAFDAFIRLSGKWRPSILPDSYHIVLCLSWFPVTSKSWCTYDLCSGIVCMSWNTGWLRFGASLQKFWWLQVENECLVDVSSLPRSGIYHLCSFEHNACG